MKVAFMSGLPPERQEQLIDIWLRLRRNPTGGYTSSSIAEAIIQRAVDSAREDGDIRIYDGSSPHWYRRFRASDRRKAKPRTPGHVRDSVRRAVRRAPVAA